MTCHATYRELRCTLEEHDRGSHYDERAGWHFKRREWLTPSQMLDGAEQGELFAEAR